MGFNQLNCRSAIVAYMHFFFTSDLDKELIGIYLGFIRVEPGFLMAQGNLNINFLSTGKFFRLFLSADVFKNKLQKFLQQYHHCQTVWIQIRADDISPNCFQRLSADGTSR